ncbi:unnamed protein product, partial [Pelagomonas calceolata]
MSSLTKSWKEPSCVLFASLPWTRPMAAATRLRSRRGLRALAARAARRARSIQHLPLPAFAWFVSCTRVAACCQRRRAYSAARLRVMIWPLRELALPASTRLFAARGSNLRQHGSLVHPEEILDAESHAYATLSRLRAE